MSKRVYISADYDWYDGDQAVVYELQKWGSDNLHIVNFIDMSNPSSGGGDNYHKDILKAWTPENPNSDIPRWQYGDLYPASTSDRFLVDASYLNFQNAQVGYTLPQKFTQKFKVSKLRLYVACDNIVYWSYRKGLDPRYSFSGSTNNAVNSPIRTISGGINITF